MKTLLLWFSLLSVAVASAATPPDDLVLHKFKAAFPHIVDIDWRSNGLTWEAVYTENQIKVRLTYDTKGEVISVYRYYGGEALSPFIKSVVLHRFPAQRIFGVTEWTTSSDKLYFVVLEDEKHWYHVEVNCYGTASLTKKYKKA